MSQQKQKYYVVWHGHKPGIYSTWPQAQAQVKNFPGAIYKSFSSRLEAEEAYGTTPDIKRSFVRRKEPVKAIKNTDFVSESISVDAACSGNPGAMEYRGVWTSDKTEIFHFGPVKNGTNNIGEFLAIVHALALLAKKNDQKTIIYTDSKTAISWVKKKKANTKLKMDKTNFQLFEMITRAENWLKNNTWQNPILKWETEIWGEIAADFGRK
ncbi:MAG TPA: ribonuclease H family protein [Saprospiraceae bacterium]|nr:ribonuclease H family protein [Saprospiraceae bacterium]